MKKEKQKQRIEKCEYYQAPINPSVTTNGVNRDNPVITIAADPREEIAAGPSLGLERFGVKDSRQMDVQGVWPPERWTDATRHQDVGHTVLLDTSHKDNLHLESSDMHRMTASHRLPQNRPKATELSWTGLRGVNEWKILVNSSNQ